MPVVTQPIRMMLAGAFVAAAAFTAIAHADHPHGPPPEAFEACASSKTGDACTVTHHDHTMAGTCEMPREAAAGSALACRPDHPPGPPPEAISACATSKSGDPCSVTFGDHTLTGTCDTGPHGDGTLACHPAGHDHHDHRDQP